MAVRRRDPPIHAWLRNCEAHCFGSAVPGKPVEPHATRLRARFRMGGACRALLGFRVLYSRVLLAACAAPPRRGYDRAPRP